MKLSRLLPSLLLLPLLLASAHLRAAPTPALATPPQPDAGGVSLAVPEDELIEATTSLSLSFPAAMVGTDKIDLGAQPCPLRFTPDLKGDWLWKSQTDGEFVVKSPVVPGQRYAVTLSPGLRDETGVAVNPANWGASLHTKAFEVETTWGDATRVSAKPAVVLKFTYPVRLQDAAGRIYFQDRDSHARQPAEFALREEDRDDEPEAATLSASPRDPLPPGRTWDLVVEDVREQASGEPTGYLKSFPLGKTEPLALQWLGAFNLPLEKPLVRARFDDFIDPGSVTRDSVRVEPAVPNLKVRADGEDVVAEGDFDRTKTYKVTIQGAVKGRRGFGLAAAVTRGATFRPKASALFFPGAEIKQRSKLGLNFSFLQVHTGALRWRLASVPLEKVALVRERLREFQQFKKNPVSGEMEVNDAGVEVPQPTELLVDTLKLATSGEGTFPASQDEAELVRQLRWSPPGGAGVPPGAYLLEVAGPGWDGKGTVGNRSLVFFSETVLTEKRTVDTVLARLAGMADGLPRPGIVVRALSASNFEVARATTDGGGVARFAADDLKPMPGQRGGEPARTLVADTPEGPAVAPLDGPSFDGSEPPARPKEEPPPTVARGVVLTDRSLYRPGQTVRLKGLVRLAPSPSKDDGRTPLRVPAGQKVSWSVTPSYEREPLAGGETTVDADGGWTADWAIPAGFRLGSYEVRCTLEGADASRDVRTEDIHSADIRIQDYKVPLFEVAAENVPGDPAARRAVCRVRANYFSGQPVAGGKVSWRVHWDRRDFRATPEENEGELPTQPVYNLDDYQSEHARALSGEEANPPELKGEAKLDGRGGAEIAVEPPPNLPGARYTVRWEVAVTSADAQSVAAPKNPQSTVMLQPVLLGVAADASGAEAPEDAAKAPPEGTVHVRVAAFDAADAPARTGSVKVEVFHVGNKTVRENVAPFVTRYRNVPRYDSVFTKTLAGVGPDTAPLDVPAKARGRYVAVLTAPGLRPVSTETFLTGPGEDEVPVQTETSLVLKAEKSEYAPGETAAFVTRSPVTGTAWVSIETDHVVDGLLLPLPGNTTRLEIPVKPEYAPDATVAVYLLRPGGGDRLPAERFATAALKVRRPDRVLDVRASVPVARVRPGGEIRAEARVTSEGKPVAGADVTLWAVDDAILALGEWKGPDFSRAFYPGRPHGVVTYPALRDYVTDIARKSLFEKGFIIGGGGEEFQAKFVRKDFQPLAYWKTGLRTDADGRVAVAFAAPDNLTRYRVVVVTQTRAGQFGEGEASVDVAKPLSVEPSLPRFLRAGDTVELRAVARQGERDHAEILAACRTDAGFVLQGNAHDASAKAVPADRDAPAVFRFVGTVPDDGRTSAKISFRAGTADGAADLTDAVEVTLPILPPTVLRRESVVGAGRPGGDVAELLPEDARGLGAAGHYDVAIGTSPDLPRLQALPEVLEYPHGCFEQITSRILVYCAVQDLFGGLPTDPQADAERRRIVERALERCQRGQLADGSLPYWTDKEANPFVTVQGAWAARLAQRAGFKVDDEMLGKLAGATDRIAADGSADPFVLALALLVQADQQNANGGAAVSPKKGGAGAPGLRTKAPSTDDADAEDSGGGDEGEGDDSPPKATAVNRAEVPPGFNEKLARTLFLHRETLGDDGRAVLAVALSRAKVMPREADQLLREILPLAKGTRRAPERAFNAAAFGSTRRTGVTALWACAELHPGEWKPADADAARKRLGEILDGAPLNSTQENLWALLAFDAVRKADKAPKLRLAGTRPAPELVSPDGTAATWSGLTLGGGTPLFRPPTDLAPNARAALSCVLTAEYRVGKAEEDKRRDRGGLRVERVVRNLTDSKRTGRAGEAAVRINDRLFVSYRLQTPKLRAYVALEDELPAGLEAVNPDLPLFAPFYDLPPTPPGEHAALLSSSELKDNVTRLYFDRLEPGVSTSGVLVRATAAGTFRWPATQAGPMYEPAVGGLAPSQEITVSAEE